MAGIVSFLRSRVGDPVVRQLRQGATPSQLALSLALGVVLSSMPVLGFTGAVCVAVAALLRLNQPAILAANYAATPLQLLLYIPFFRAGAWLFGAHPVSFSLDQIRSELDAGVLQTVGRYWDANLRAMAAFGAVAPLAVGLLYVILRPVLALLPLPRGAEDGGPAAPARIE